MSKKTKIWLIVASCLVFAGLILFASVMMANGWDFSILSTSKFETNTYTLSETFSVINIDTDTADVVFLLSEDGNCTVVCYEMENANHLVEVVNDALCIGIRDEREWFEYIGINFGSPKITVTLPKKQYDKLILNGDTGDVDIPKDFQFGILDISVDTGDIRIENVSANTLNLTVSTGDTYLSNIQCKNLMTKGSTGDIVLKNVIATDKFSIERSTGDVKFDSCDAPEILVKTDTGDVTGSLLSEKVFITKTSTGKVDVPLTTSGGKCSVTTSTGDIRLEQKIG